MNVNSMNVNSMERGVSLPIHLFPLLQPDELLGILSLNYAEDGEIDLDALTEQLSKSGDTVRLMSSWFF